MKLLLGTVLVVVLALLFSRLSRTEEALSGNSQVTLSERILDRSETSELELRQNELDRLARRAGNLSDEALWEEVEAAWENKETQGDWLTMLSRELGGRCRGSDLHKIAALGESGDLWRDASLTAAFCAWIEQNPLRVGEDFVSDLGEKNFLNPFDDSAEPDERRFPPPLSLRDRWVIISRDDVQERLIKGWEEADPERFREHLVNGAFRARYYKRFLPLSLALKSRLIDVSTRQHLNKVSSDQMMSLLDPSPSENLDPVLSFDVFEDPSLAFDLSIKELLNSVPGYFVDEWVRLRPADFFERLQSEQQVSPERLGEIAKILTRQGKEYQSVLEGLGRDIQLSVLESAAREVGAFHPTQEWPLLGEAGAGVALAERRRSLSEAIEALDLPEEKRLELRARIGSDSRTNRADE